MSMTLADRQAALLAALAGEGAVPAGFDVSRVSAAAEALAFKRARAVVQAWPSLRTMLGGQFRDRFAAYAATTPLPAEGGPLADGRRFARMLACERTLSDETRLQVLSVDVNWREIGAGLRPRRWPVVRIARLRERAVVVIAFGARRYEIQLPLRR